MILGPCGGSDTMRMSNVGWIAGARFFCGAPRRNVVVVGSFRLGASDT